MPSNIDALPGLTELITGAGRWLAQGQIGGIEGTDIQAPGLLDQSFLYRLLQGGLGPLPRTAPLSTPVLTLDHISLPG